jgi:tyrosinase
MRIRKNQASLTAAERKAFVDAVLALKKRGTYDTFVQIHSDFMLGDPDGGGVTAHGAPSFLPWHRQLLLEFEGVLQTVNPAVTIPYWDWTVDNQATSSIFADDFMGGDGRLDDDVVTTGPFAGANGQWPITVTPDDGPQLFRSFGRFGQAVLPSKADLDSVMSRTIYDTPPWTSDTSFRYTVESLLHSPPHVWVAGQMVSGSSPNDPLFWLHHCMIDKVWTEWQRLHPAAGYQPVEPTTGLVHLDGLMKPWKTTTPKQMLDVSQLYTYA